MSSQEPLITKILNHEISRLIAVIAGVYAFISMIILPIQKMEMQISEIESNDLKHIESTVMEIKNQHSLLEPRLDGIEQSLIRLEEAIKK